MRQFLGADPTPGAFPPQISKFCLRALGYMMRQEILERIHIVASNAGLTFRVPEPPARPGDAPDFSSLDIPPAGSVPRPDCLTPEPELRDLPYTLIRVLDDEGRAVGDWDPQLPPETLRKALRAMML